MRWTPIGPPLLFEGSDWLDSRPSFARSRDWRDQNILMHVAFRIQRHIPFLGTVVRTYSSTSVQYISVSRLPKSFCQLRQDDVYKYRSADCRRMPVRIDHIPRTYNILLAYYRKMQPVIFVTTSRRNGWWCLVTSHYNTNSGGIRDQGGLCKKKATQISSAQPDSWAGAKDSGMAQKGKPPCLTSLIPSMPRSQHFSLQRGDSEIS